MRHALCISLEHASNILKANLSERINRRIHQHFSLYVVNALTRLDIPTYEDPRINSQLHPLIWSYLEEDDMPNVWDLLCTMLDVFTIAISLLTQTGILMKVMQKQEDGWSMVFLSSAPLVMKWMQERRFENPSGTSHQPHRKFIY